VREELGIPEDARAILYAPTWRDDQPFSFELPLDELSAKLGPDHVWLFRAHRLDVPQIDWRQTERAVNVSAWHDIGALYFAADVLVTDYSSVMFDFAITGKPMLFFTPDLALFRDDLRGFYFDFPADAPGPLLETVDEVVDALGDLAGVNARSGDAYARFRERFCHLDDGRASERVLDAVIDGRRVV
jgi:CDP-glycerol glycerophosphotransferase